MRPGLMSSRQTGVSLYAYYGALYPTYVRGLAYQQLHRYREAAAEFQRMLDHPGLLLADPIGPAARLQLARVSGTPGYGKIQSRI